MRIVDGSGTNVAKYRYDPYGNLVSSSGTMAANNPLRYRGYYFDSETGFYYLQSRYYDPEIARFINADDFASTGQGILGHNMFAYCLNNPVNYSDCSGTSSTVAIEEGLKYVVALLAALDSATPFVEIMVVAALGVVAINELIDKQREEVGIVTTGIKKTSKHQEFFPENPLEFAPLGLIPKVCVDIGEKDGGIIKWEIPGTKIAIFEWDEDFQYGPHYHVMHATWKNQHLDPNHYKSGDPVPEPWNTQFFAYKKG